MKAFIEKYADRIHGVLSCFDRMLFRGYLPIMSGWQMAQFFNGSGIRFRELKPAVLPPDRCSPQSSDLQQSLAAIPFYLNDSVRSASRRRATAAPYFAASFRNKSRLRSVPDT